MCRTINDAGRIQRIKKHPVYYLEVYLGKDTRQRQDNKGQHAPNRTFVIPEQHKTDIQSQKYRI